MPLTPHEQRILEEIERKLAEEDPRLVQSVSKATVAAHALRRIRWGLAGFLAGFILLLMFVVAWPSLPATTYATHTIAIWTRYFLKVPSLVAWDRSSFPSATAAIPLIHDSE